MFPLQKRGIGHCKKRSDQSKIETQQGKKKKNSAAMCPASGLVTEVSGLHKAWVALPLQQYCLQHIYPFSRTSSTLCFQFSQQTFLGPRTSNILSSRYPMVLASPASFLADIPWSWHLHHPSGSVKTLVF